MLRELDGEAWVQIPTLPYNLLDVLDPITFSQPDCCEDKAALSTLEEWWVKNILEGKLRQYFLICIIYACCIIPAFVLAEFGIH